MSGPELKIQHFTWGRSCGYETHVTWDGKTVRHWSAFGLALSKRGALRKWRKYTKMKHDCDC